MSQSFELVKNQLLAETDIDNQLRQAIEFLPLFGFLAITEGQATAFVGFHGDVTDRQSIVPALSAEERQEGRRALNQNAKGYGVIIGNSLASVRRPTSEGRDRRIGLYLTPFLEQSEITSIHHDNPMNPFVMASNILSHAKLMRLAKRQGDAAAIRQIEQRYGSAALAIFDPAPVFLIKGRSDHIATPLWAIWRDQQQRPLERIASVTS